MPEDRFPQGIIAAAEEMAAEQARPYDDMEIFRKRACKPPHRGMPTICCDYAILLGRIDKREERIRELEEALLQCWIEALPGHDQCSECDLVQGIVERSFMLTPAEMEAFARAKALGQ